MKNNEKKFTNKAKGFIKEHAVGISCVVGGALGFGLYALGYKKGEKYFLNQFKDLNNIDLTGKYAVSNKPYVLKDFVANNNIENVKDILKCSEDDLVNVSLIVQKSN